MMPTELPTGQGPDEPERPAPPEARRFADEDGIDAAPPEEEPGPNPATDSLPSRPSLRNRYPRPLR